VLDDVSQGYPPPGAQVYAEREPEA